MGSTRPDLTTLTESATVFTYDEREWLSDLWEVCEEHGYLFDYGTSLQTGFVEVFSPAWCR